MAKGKKKKKGIILFTTLLVVLFGALFAIQMINEKSTNISGLAADKPAPGFTLQSTQGEISLADYKGKNVVLYFYEGNS